MNALKELTAVLRTATTLLVVILAPAILDIASMSMDMIVTVRLINVIALWILKLILYIICLKNLRCYSTGASILYIDIDECAEQLDECQQICNNTIGSYVCDCRIGYALNSDGRTCRGKNDEINVYYQDHCQDHWLISIAISWSDINECDLGIDRCDQNCHNNIGSYTCSCNAGWRLDFDGFRCNGVHMCMAIVTKLNLTTMWSSVN